MYRWVVRVVNADAPALLSVRATAHWPEGWDGAGAASVTSCPRTVAAASTYLVPLLQETTCAAGSFQSAGFV